MIPVFNCLAIQDPDIGKRPDAAARIRAAKSCRPYLSRSRLFSIYLDNFLALVETAVGANLVRHRQLSALGAFGERGRLELPNTGASLVTSCS